LFLVKLEKTFVLSFDLDRISTVEIASNIFLLENLVYFFIKDAFVLYLCKKCEENKNEPTMRFLGKDFPWWFYTCARNVKKKK